jgi:hypothetical protein
MLTANDDVKEDCDRKCVFRNFDVVSLQRLILSQNEFKSSTTDKLGKAH